MILVGLCSLKEHKTGHFRCSQVAASLITIWTTGKKVGEHSEDGRGWHLEALSFRWKWVCAINYIWIKIKTGPAESQVGGTRWGESKNCCCIDLRYCSWKLVRSSGSDGRGSDGTKVLEISDETHIKNKRYENETHGRTLMCQMKRRMRNLITVILYILTDARMSMLRRKTRRCPCLCCDVPRRLIVCVVIPIWKTAKYFILSMVRNWTAPQGRYTSPIF